MTKKTIEDSLTSVSPSDVNYKKATGIECKVQAMTTLPSGDIRRVVTTTLSGSIDLRYVPRDPKVSEKNTAY